MVKAGAKLGTMRVQPVGLGLTPPIDQRLDQLLYLAHQAGRQASRQRIVGALIRDSPTTADEVAAMLDRYQDTDEAEALISGVPLLTAGDIKKPGRRRAPTKTR